MNPTTSSLSVCVRDHAACVKVAGRANFTSSVDFKKLIQQLQDDGCDSIVLDLSECQLMDSTFLGVVAGIAFKCDAQRNGGSRCCLKLFNPTERVIELLDNLGVLSSFTIVQDPPNLGRFEPFQKSDTTRIELNRTCLEAHKTLMNVSPENERRFKDATEFFEQNLRKEEGKE